MQSASSRSATIISSGRQQSMARRQVAALLLARPTALRMVISWCSRAAASADASTASSNSAGKPVASSPRCSALPDEEDLPGEDLLPEEPAAVAAISADDMVLEFAGGELVTVSSAVLRVATSSDTVRELFSHAPEGSSTRTVCGKELEVVAVEGDDAYTWQTVLKLLLRPSSARLTWDNFEDVATLADKYALKEVLWACSDWAAANKDDVPCHLPNMECPEGFSCMTQAQVANAYLYLAALCDSLGMEAAYEALWPMIERKAEIGYGEMIAIWIDHLKAGKFPESAKRVWLDLLLQAASK